MKPPCEIMVKQILPVFRAIVAEDLVNVRGLTQTEAASKLGITQAAVSQYLREKRGHNLGSEKFMTSVHAMAGEFAEKLASQVDGVETTVTANFCKICPLLAEQILDDARVKD
jgi:uncharacterized protein